MQYLFLDQRLLIEPVVPKNALLNSFHHYSWSLIWSYLFFYFLFFYTIAVFWSDQFVPISAKKKVGL